MANWIKQRIVEDKIYIEKMPFLRRAIYLFDENRYKVIWYIMRHGRRIIKNPAQFNKLEALYQARKDRP